MTKQKNPKKTKPAQKRRSQRKGRINPLVGRVETVTSDTFLESAGNVMIYAAVTGCTFQEKALISVLIPLLLPLLKSVAASMTLAHASDIYDQAEEIADRAAALVETTLRAETPVRHETDDNR